MFIDARTTTTHSVIETDLCIIGSGPAGMTIAREFIGTSVGVMLVESGGFDYDTITQRLYQGENRGEAYDPLDVCRLRFLGGTSNHWGGWTRRLDPWDFEKREHVPHSGWPITEQELRPYYEDTERLLELGKHRYDAAYWTENTDSNRLLDRDNIITNVFRLSPPTRFRLRYGLDIERAENIHALMYGNLVDFDFQDNKEVASRARIATQTGNRFSIRARAYVLACGGIENARLLLACNKDHAMGIGNQNDNVGRYFADHYGIWGGNLVFSGDIAGNEFYRVHQPRILREQGEALQIVPSLGLRPELLRSAGLVNFTNYFLPQAEGLATFDDRQRAGQAADDVRALARLVGGAATPAPADATAYQVITSFEPTPNPQSRVLLAQEKDELGLRKVILDWRLAPEDEAATKKLNQVFAAQFGAAGLGRMYVNPAQMWPLKWKDYGRHHMGTTRMSATPADGVVDRDCRIHGLRNLYVAGSSVFPTYGYAQPTYTIVALALRLAAHLKARLEREGTRP